MGFEPMTFWATTRRSKPTELRPHGAADGVRTRDLLNGNQVLYQVELQPHIVDTRGLEPRFFHVAFWRDPSTLHRFHARKAAMGIYLHTAVFTSVLLTLLILPVRSYPGAHYRIRTCDPLLVRQML